MEITVIEIQENRQELPILIYLLQRKDSEEQNKKRQIGKQLDKEVLLMKYKERHILPQHLQRVEEKNNQVGKKEPLEVLVF